MSLLTNKKSNTRSLHNECTNVTGGLLFWLLFYLCRRLLDCHNGNNKVLPNSFGSIGIHVCDSNKQCFELRFLRRVLDSSIHQSVRPHAECLSQNLPWYFFILLLLIIIIVFQSHLWRWHSLCLFLYPSNQAKDEFRETLD